MTVRAKLFVASVERGASTPDTVKITLGAVTRGEDNRAWAEATPSATFTMTIQNPAAAVQFALGQEFYVDFIPAEERLATMSDGHEYQPSAYQQELIDKGDRRANDSHYRCEACHCRRESHEEPLRSALADWRP